MTDFQLHFPKILDNTICTSYAKCPRQMFYNHMMHLQTPGPQVHLDAGKVYAKALETARLAYYLPSSETYLDSEASIMRGFRAAIKSWGYNRHVDEVFAKTKKEFHRTMELYLGYFARFGFKTDHIRPHILNGQPAVEKSFTLELDIKNPDTGDPILYHGRWDMLVDYQNALFTYDDKTCSQLGVTWASQWEMRTQFTGYIYGAKHYGLDVVGAITRGACFYVDRVDYQESISRRARWQLDQWWEDLHQLVYDMVQRYQMMKNTPHTKLVELHKIMPATGMFNEACKQYAGCNYTNLCKSQRPGVWLRDYTTRVWDPTNPDKEED